MKSLNIERYATFNPTDRALFEGFSHQSLLMRFDAIEDCVKGDRPKEILIAAAEQHFRSTMVYLDQARSDWAENLGNANLFEVEQICLAAIHYSHCRLLPAFSALSLAGNNCLQDCREYLLIEQAFLDEITVIRSMRTSSDLGLPDSSYMDNPVIEKLAKRYRQALMYFANALILHIEWTSICLNLDIKNWQLQ